MKRHFVLFVALLFAAALLAGCLGGDDEPGVGKDDDDNDSNTGTVRGRILTLDLNEVANARVALVADNEVVSEARSEDNGNYEIKDVEPGSYRLQVSAACCKENVQNIQVEAGKVLDADVQLQRFTANDLKDPYIDEREWEGFLSCALGTPVLVISVCSLEELDDPNDSFIEFFDIEEGIKTVSVGMVWEPAGGVLGDTMQIALEDEGCGLECSQVYGDAEGTSPLVFHAGSPGGDNAYDEITNDNPRPLQFRVFPTFDVNVYYQQPFTVYYHLHYHKAAPEGYDPIPDA